MTKLKKSLCKVSKEDVLGNLDEILKVVSKPRYICEKCARVSKRKKLVCHPIKFPDIKK